MLSSLYRLYDHAKRKGSVLGQLSWACCELQWHCPIGNLKRTKITSKPYFAEITQKIFCLHRLGYRWENVLQGSFHHCSPGQQMLLKMSLKSLTHNVVQNTEIPKIWSNLLSDWSMQKDWSLISFGKTNKTNSCRYKCIFWKCIF